MAKTTTIGRSAVTGQFKSVDTARRYPTTHVVERIAKAPTCKDGGKKK